MIFVDLTKNIEKLDFYQIRGVRNDDFFVVLFIFVTVGGGLHFGPECRLPRRFTGRHIPSKRAALDAVYLTVCRMFLCPK